jgi:hypothetical protein
MNIDPISASRMLSYRWHRLQPVIWTSQPGGTVVMERRAPITG